MLSDACPLDRPLFSTVGRSDSADDVSRPIVLFHPNPLNFNTPRHASVSTTMLHFGVYVAVPRGRNTDLDSVRMGLLTLGSGAARTGQVLAYPSRGRRTISKFFVILSNRIFAFRHVLQFSSGSRRSILNVTKQDRARRTRTIVVFRTGVAVIATIFARRDDHDGQYKHRHFVTLGFRFSMTPWGSARRQHDCYQGKRQKTAGTHKDCCLNLCVVVVGTAAIKGIVPSFGLAVLKPF